MIVVQAPPGGGSDKPKYSSGYTPTPFTIVIDTREQKPWYFTKIAADKERDWLPLIENRGLKTGDYSIKGFEDHFTIERKSLADLYGSVGQGRERFEAEHQRMREIVDAGGYCCVIVEAGQEDAIFRPPMESGLSGKVILGTQASWFLRYRVPWFFPGSCRMAELLAFKLMEKAFQQFTEGAKR